MSLLVSFETFGDQTFANLPDLRDRQNGIDGRAATGVGPSQVPTHHISTLDPSNRFMSFLKDSTDLTIIYLEKKAIDNATALASTGCDTTNGVEIEEEGGANRPPYL